MLFFKAATLAATAALSLLPYAVPAVTVAVGAHGFFKFGKFIKEGAELARRAGEQKQRDPVRKINQGKVKKIKKKFRARLRRRAAVTFCEETNIDGHYNENVALSKECHLIKGLRNLRSS